MTGFAQVEPHHRLVESVLPQPAHPPSCAAGTNGCSAQPVAVLKAAGMNPADAFVSDKVYTLQVSKYQAEEVRSWCWWMAALWPVYASGRHGSQHRTAMQQLPCGTPPCLTNNTTCCPTFQPAERFLADCQRRQRAAAKRQRACCRRRSIGIP